MPVWEIVVRTSLVYLAIVFLLRVIPKRSAGNLSPNEMLALVLVGALAADGIMGGTHSVANVLIMIAVIVGWTERSQRRLPAAGSASPGLAKSRPFYAVWPVVSLLSIIGVEPPSEELRFPPPPQGRAACQCHSTPCTLPASRKPPAREHVSAAFIAKSPSHFR
jgi:hypothetical protein